MDGSSHQGTGIVPDVPLPEHAGYSRSRESQHPHHLRNDSARMRVTFDPLPELPLAMLADQSRERVGQDSNFMAFTALNDSIRPLYRGEVRIPLGFEAFKSQYEHYRQFFDAIGSLKAIPGKGYAITSNSTERAKLGSDPYLAEIHREMIKNLSEDFYLEEAYRVLADLVSSLNGEGGPGP